MLCKKNKKKQKTFMFQFVMTNYHLKKIRNIACVHRQNIYFVSAIMLNKDNKNNCGKNGLQKNPAVTGLPEVTMCSEWCWIPLTLTLLQYSTTWPWELVEWTGSHSPTRLSNTELPIIPPADYSLTFIFLPAIMYLATPCLESLSFRHAFS